MSENTVKCTECGNTFKFFKNLRAHIKKKHPLTNIDSIAPTKKIKNKELYVFSCSECEKSFCHIKNLNEHKLIAHSIEVVKPDLNYPIECLEFENFENFNIWKNEIEHKTKSCYIKNCGSIDNDHSNKTFIYYKCHRNGNYISKGTGLRHLKTQGSNKINGHCPSCIDVTICKLSNICTVKFIANHLGHDNDLGHLPLNKDVRINIASKMSQHIPFENILDEIRDNISNNSLERIHLLTRKDLHNIQTSYNLNNKAILHANDAISVESWVQNLKKDDKFSLIYYKQQDEINTQFSNLKKDDFLLIIMNNYQQSMLEKYGHDVICIDETHGMNSYHFNLTTLLVLDDMREGFPCAFMISNRIDEAVLTIFYSKIKSLTGQLQPNVFMSDMAESFFNAWIVEMKHPKHRLYCTWHVDRAWRKNLVKIKSKDKQYETYKLLRTLLHEQDTKAFERIFEEAINQLSADDHTIDFANYFVNNYGALLNLGLTVIVFMQE